MFDDVAACLGSGPAARLRPLLPGEVEPLEAVFAGLSARSREHRYLTGMSRLPEAMRRALTTVDGRDHVAWLATVNNAPAGISRYVRVSEDTAEIGFEVVDALQGRGIGAVLFDALTLSAFTNGIRWFTGVVHPQNETTAGMLRRRGMRLGFSNGLLEGVGPVIPRHLSRVRYRTLTTMAARHASAHVGCIQCSASQLSA